MGSLDSLLWKRCIYSATVSTLKIPIGIQNKVTFTDLIVLHSVVSRKQPPTMDPHGGRRLGARPPAEEPSPPAC
ncbi:Nitric Oxide Synthase, Brain [Manis pentadactyla]|nr:Nitric Oxide Synthase, Brain [Manis pentadactyla]